MLNLTFWGGVGCVTGANFLLEDTKTKILVDCGLYQGDADSSNKNSDPFPYDPSSIKYLFVTHSHMDHIGRIPKLVKDGFSGEIYSTPETKEIVALMFEDQLKIMETESRFNGKEPMFGTLDVKNTLDIWKTITYHGTKSFPEGFSVYLKDAGHVLGSTIYEFLWEGKKIVFTGDLGNSPTPLLRDTEEVTDTDYMIMESVYGDKNHESRDERVLKLEEYLKKTIKRGGTVVIPAFSLERTQVILYEINNLVEEGKIPSVPVFLDSPLAIKITEIYRRMSKNFNGEARKEISLGDDLFKFPKLKFTARSEDSRNIENIHGPKIIIAGSGMSNGGRVVSHEMVYLPDPKSMILLMGYEAAGTMGRRLEDGEKYVMIYGSHIPVRAEIKNIKGFSSHKDSDHLVNFAKGCKDTVKKIFTVMGEPKSSLYLAQRLRDYNGEEAIYPERGNVYKLD